MKTARAWCALALALESVVLQAQLTETFTFTDFDQGTNPGLCIPDGNAAGVSDTREINSAIGAIGSLTVRLDLASDYAQDASGAFNGDLYVYLRHESGFCVLLNRVGRSELNPAGYNDSGMIVTLRDHGTSGDIHSYGVAQSPAPGSPLTGTWQPDARALDPAAPATSFDGTPRTAFLESFQGLNPNGTWVLFAADLEGGGAAILNSWELQFTAVPEPPATALLVALGLAAYALLRRQGP